MTKLELSGLEGEAAEAALLGDASDPVALMKSAGCDVKVFFQFGNWNDVDFRKSNLSGISFLGADMSGAIVTSDQLQAILSTAPKKHPTEQNVRAFNNEIQTAVDTIVENHPHVPNLSGDESVSEPQNGNQPHNIELEQEIIGTILSNNDTFYRVSDFLTPEHFSENLHAEIYRVASELIRNARRADASLVLAMLGNRHSLIGEISVEEYINRLMSQNLNVDDIEGSGRTMLDLANRRRLLQLAEKVRTMAGDVGGEVREQISEAEDELFRITQQDQDGAGFKTISDAFGGAIDMAAAAYQRDGSLSGLATGLANLDRMLRGLHPSDLFILAAGPSTGKIALATTIAYNVAEAYESEVRPDGTVSAINGGIVGYFSLEHTSEELATRILSSQVNVSVENIRSGKLRDSEFEKLVGAAQKLEQLPLFIDDDARSMTQIFSRSRRLKREKGLDILIVDNVQLLSSISDMSSPATNNMVDTFKSLTRLAYELSVTLIAISEDAASDAPRTTKSPSINGLRTLGSIDKYADIITFLSQRDQDNDLEPQFLIDEDQANWQTQNAETNVPVEVIIAKNRHGPTGSTHLYLDRDFARFYDLDKIDIPDEVQEYDNEIPF